MEPRILVYKYMASPLGTIKLVTSDVGLAAILWEGEDDKRTKLPTAEINDQHPILLQTEHQLREYFAKERKVFDIPLDFQNLKHPPMYRIKYAL